MPRKDKKAGGFSNHSSEKSVPGGANEKARKHKACGLFGGSGWIRTTEVRDNRFTVCPLWPLGNAPIFGYRAGGSMELVDGFEPPTC